MGKIFGIIGSLLAVLVGVAFYVTIHEDDVREEKKAEAAMFHLAPIQVDRIMIDAPDGTRAQLVRVDGRWILPDLNGFPAEADKVETLLHRLLAIDREQPAGTGAAVLEDLRLSDDNFERRITLARGGDRLASVIIGKARGPRHVYLRRADEDTAYTVVFGLFDAAPASVEWIDRGALKMTRSDITAIEVDGLRMVATSEDAAAGWQLADDAAAGEVKQTAAAHLAGLLADLEIESVLSEAETTEADAPLLILSLTGKDGIEIEYALSTSSETDGYVLRVSNRSEAFRLTAYSARQLISAARRDALLAPADGVSHHAASSTATPGAAVPGSHN